MRGQCSGVVGLGSNEISLVTRLGSKFSYCFGRIRDPQYIHNQLVLGDGAKIEGPSTPLEILDGLYYLTLEGISVDQENLDISPEVFKRSPYNNFGGVIIDSGSSLTSLARDAFNSLNNEVQRLTNGLLEGVKSSDRPGPCYKGVINRDLIGFPVVTFHFANGVDLVLDIESMFHEIATNQFCMVVVPSDLGDNMSIIGVFTQQNYNVAYDLGRKTLSVQWIDCELLESL